MPWQQSVSPLALFSFVVIGSQPYGLVWAIGWGVASEHTPTRIRAGATKTKLSATS
ncbi:MAG: hypothetical protein KDA92_18775 [Planctomycetales bacterium]|nr:hypothetical protein [Planctomycetales bacterium]